MNFIVLNFVLQQKYLTKTFTNTLFLKYKSNLNKKILRFMVTSSSVSTIVP